jgi:hypothetical protein
METQWFPVSKKFKTQKSSSKVLASVFWDKSGIFLVDYLKKCTTITAKYYVALIDKLKQQLTSKSRGMLSKGITHQKLADLHFEFVKHQATHLI